MKKYLEILLISLSFFLGKDVFAKEYNTMELIPVEETATVETREYLYTDFVYINDVPKETYGVLKFDFVKNKLKEKKPLAINFLLFDENEENIGFVAYCTTKDLRGEYSQIVVNAEAGSPLTVFVDSSYLVKGHTKDEISYLAVLDGNEKCYVGNQNKYAGLTIDQIKNGKVSPDWNENEFVNVFSFVLNVGIYTFLAILLVLLVLYTLFAVMINRLSQKMFDKKLSSRFIPIINLYHSLNIAFGRIVAWIGFGGLLISIVLGIVSSNWILFYCMMGLAFISIVVNMIKYFTKNYDLLFFDPFIVNDGTNPTYFWKKIKVTGEKKAQQILDLNYSEKDLQEGIQTVDEGSNQIEFTPIQNNVIDSKEKMLQRLEEGDAAVPINSGVPLPSEVINPPVDAQNVVEPSPVVLNTQTPNNEEKAANEEEKKEDSFMDMFR